MKEKRYTLPDDNQPKLAAESMPSYHGNAAVALQGRDADMDGFEDEDTDWNRMSYLESPTNAEEAVLQMKAIEEDDERAGINYTVDEFFQELQKARSWQ